MVEDDGSEVNEIESGENKREGKDKPKGDLKAIVDVGLDVDSCEEED